jgi:hypothetical protein
VETFGIVRLPGEPEVDRRVVAFGPELGGLPEEIWGVECGGDLGTDAGDFAEFGRRLRENA